MFRIKEDCILGTITYIRNKIPKNAKYGCDIPLSEDSYPIYYFKPSRITGYRGAFDNVYYFCKNSTMYNVGVKLNETDFLLELL